jgi:hypothetical protein
LIQLTSINRKKEAFFTNPLLEDIRVICYLGRDF